jgi:hypothetical protein
MGVQLVILGNASFLFTHTFILGENVFAFISSLGPFFDLTQFHLAKAFYCPSQEFVRHSN